MKYIIGIIFLTLILAGCGDPQTAKQTLVANDNTNDNTANDNSNAATDNSNDLESFTGSLDDLIAKKKPLKCTWSITAEGMISQGTLYINGEKYRSDVTSDKIEMHYLSDGTNIYMWDSMQAKGTMISVADMDEMEVQTGTDVDESEMTAKDLDGVYNYQCSSWSTENSKFNPPSDIEFVDIGAQMKEYQQMAENMENNPCAACDFLPDGEAKEQCLADC